MTSRSPPVPSKNALRALRNITFSAPGLIIGAAGSVCGLVAVNCEARRKVRLAEKILHTKRTIASVANGRSSSQVRHMFEAAEKGEEFLLDPTKAYKRREKRSYPSKATARKDQPEDVETTLQAIGGRIVGHKKPGVKNGSEDARASPGQPKDVQPGGNLSTQIMERQTLSEPWWDTGDSTEPHKRSQQYRYGRRDYRLRSSKKTFATTSSENSNAMFSRGRRSLLSGVRSGQNDSEIQSHENDSSWTHLEALKHQYRRDVQESPAERIRKASLKPMKQDRHSAYGRHPQGTDWRTSPPSDLVRETSETSDLVPLDLAPRLNDSSLHSSCLGPKTTHLAIPPSIIASDEVPGTCGGEQSSQGKNSLGQLEMIDSTFSEWPGIERVTMDLSPDMSRLQNKSVAVQGEMDMFEDNIDVLSIFDRAHYIIKSKLADSDPVQSESRGQAVQPAARQNIRSTEIVENGRANRTKWLWLHHGRNQTDWLTVLKRAKSTDVWIGTLECDILQCARRSGQDVLAYKTWTAAQKRKEEILIEDAQLLATRWGLPNDSMKHIVSPSSSILNDTAFERSAATDMFLALPPTLGEQGQADIAEVLQGVDFLLYADVCANIMSYEHCSDSSKALASKLRELVSKGSDQDLKLAELLFHALFKPQQKDSHLLTIPEGAMDLTHSLFTRNLPNRAAAILFPYTLEDTERLLDRSPDSQAIFLCRSAKDYLDRRLYHIQDPVVIRDEARKVLVAAKYMGFRSSGHAGYLILPAIRALCTRGQEAQAGQLLEEIQTGHDINFEDTLAARESIIFGYANRNNIVPMKLMIDELHANGVSRLNTLWFSNLLSHVFELHLLHNSIADSYDLLVHAMAYWGLMPDSRVSSALIAACLRDERYDYIQEYVQALRQLYSFLELGTNGPLCAWRCARAWKEMEATCEDIQKGCLAMAYCATSDPFGKSLRDVAEEAVRLDISRCLSTLLAMNSGRKQSDVFLQLRCLDFDKLVEKAQQLATEPGPSTKPYLQARDNLRNQIRAVTRLNKLFGGDHMGDRINPSRRHKSALRKQKRIHSKDNVASEGLAVRIFQERNILPDREVLWKLLAKHYAHRQRQGLSADHDLLQHVIQELLRLQRPIEASQLINAVHKSPFATGPDGTAFNEEVLNLWLDASALLNSPKVMVQALWAFIDTVDVVVSTSFLIRVNMASKKFTDGYYAMYRARDPLAFRDEMRHLATALKTRYWRQMGMKEEDDRSLWNEYKGWDELTAEMPAQEEGERTMWGQWMGDSGESFIGKTVRAARAF